jgi:hypothetical protein
LKDVVDAGINQYRTDADPQSGERPERCHFSSEACLCVVGEPICNYDLSGGCRYHFVKERQAFT